MGHALRKDFWDDVAPIFRGAINRDPDKLVARKLGITPRHARNLKSGECGTTAPVFMMAAMEYPEVRDLVAQYLGLAPVNATAANDLLKKIHALSATHPASGEE